jgi:hypothetical protein
MAVAESKIKLRFGMFVKRMSIRIEKHFLIGKQGRHPVWIVFIKPVRKFYETVPKTFAVYRNDCQLFGM